MIEQPLWRCGNKRDAKTMVAWVNGHLDRAEALSKTFFELLRVFRNQVGPVLKKPSDRADKGDVEPLRKLFPYLARFIHRPKLKRGQRFPKDPENDRAERAVYDVKLIRALWMQCTGKHADPRDDLVTAEQIAADRNGVDVNAVINRIKKPFEK